MTTNFVGNGQDDAGLVIAVMGATGSGKSSFVRLLTGDNSIVIGNTLESETTEPRPVRFSDPASGRRMTIVDTPGFDDSRESVSDTEILKGIAKSLLDAYGKLNGLIYVQRISDNRFGGQSTRNLRMFRNLCGEGGFKNVVVLTTFWDKVTQEEGTQHETQLKSQYFKKLVEGGARFMRHDQSPRSAQEVLKHVLTLFPTNVRIQEEIRVEHKRLEETAAGSVYRQEVEELIAKHKKEVDDWKAKIDEAKNASAAVVKELNQEREKRQRKLKEWERQRDELRKGLAAAELNEQWSQNKERESMTQIQQPQRTPDMNFTPGGDTNYPRKKGGWHHGLFECFGDIGTCCFACVCPCMVYAQVKQRVEHLNAHSTIDPHRGGSGCSGDCMLWCCLQSFLGVGWVLQGSNRGIIRGRYKIDGGICGDYCAACWCTPCELTQESREIELEERSLAA